MNRTEVDSNCANLGRDSKRLAVAIYNFLLQEGGCYRHKSGRARSRILRAADVLQRAYKITMWDILFGGTASSVDLLRVFDAGSRPIAVRDRIEAMRQKRLGNTLMGFRRYDLAEERYTKAVRLDPGNGVLYCNRAAARIGQSLFADAVGDCNRALELDRGYARAHLLLGMAHALMGRPGHAIRSYRDALRIEPGNAACLENMELIGRRIHHAALLRVLAAPFRAWRRNLACFTSGLASNKQRHRSQLSAGAKNNSSGDDREDSKLEVMEIERFNLGDLD